MKLWKRPCCVTVLRSLYSSFLLFPTWRLSLEDSSRDKFISHSGFSLHFLVTDTPIRYFQSMYRARCGAKKVRFEELDKYNRFKGHIWLRYLNYKLTSCDNMYHGFAKYWFKLELETVSRKFAMHWIKGYFSQMSLYLNKFRAIWSV